MSKLSSFKYKLLPSNELGLRMLLTFCGRILILQTLFVTI